MSIKENEENKGNEGQSDIPDFATMFLNKDMDGLKQAVHDTAVKFAHEAMQSED